MLGSVLILCFATVQAQAGRPTWTNLWQGFQSQYIDAQGRVIDHQDGGISTSEGQSYALFFALVADDRPLFDRILLWTQNNLAQGDLAKHLPGWKWGRAADGRWQLLNPDSASDGDLWLAYTLIFASRLWHDERYAQIARLLLRQIKRQETARLTGWGEVLLPGNGQYWRAHQRFIVNLSYSPPFLLAALAHADPTGPWAALYSSLPRLYAVASPLGFAPDWLALYPYGRWGVAPEGDVGSYNAIRCYLWAGMSAPSEVSNRILGYLWGMRARLNSGYQVTEYVNTLSGGIKGNGPAGFAAAVLPYLDSLGYHATAASVSARLFSAWDSTTNTFGPHYYDNALALFALGFVDHLYSFGKNGNLKVFWKKSQGGL